jgi:hypothetical protein
MLTYADVCNRAGDVGEAADGGEDTKWSTEPAAPRGQDTLQQPGPFNSSGVTASVSTHRTERKGERWRRVGCVWGGVEYPMMNKRHDLEKTE